MTRQALFLKTADLSVVEEVLRLMETDASCHDLPAYIMKLAESVPARIKGQLFRKFHGPSGAIYPVYITDDEPYVVYAILNRESEPQIEVLMAGLRSNENSATFFPSVGAEVERRAGVQGWSL